MTFLKPALLALLLATSASLVFAQTSRSTNTPLVSGENGATVYAEDLEAAAQRIPPASRTTFLSRVDNLSRQSEEIYVRRALAADAEKAGLANNPVIQALINQARERILSDLQINALEDGAKLSDETVLAYARDVYRSNPKRFETPEQTRARHILVARNSDGKPKERAADILEQLKKGASFEDLAKMNSADFSNASKGGDLGFFAAGTMVRPFESAVAKLTRPGELSDVVETEFGFHIIRLEERRKAGQRTFEEVRESLEREVRTKAATEARQARIEAIVRAAKVNAPEMEALARRYGTSKP